ncbi:MAG: LytR C-terminal domain-containing protein [Microgenomates group bacterium]
MVYLFIDEYNIKLLSLKKTVFGQQEVAFFQKKHETQLLKEGRIISVDLLASAIKEGLSLASPSSINEKDVCLILPQNSFLFTRCQVPSDIASSAVEAFVKDKARATISSNLDETINDFFVVSSEKENVVSLYAIKIEDFENFNQVFSLIDLKIKAIIPDTLAYFKLFEKTLRREKKETIFYVSFDNNSLSGYLFDSLGLLDQKRWLANLENTKAEEVLKNKINQFNEQNLKLNRIILSGAASEKVRQDTFTKAVGVWTNPLKKIISTFYGNYLKLLIVNENKPFPLLDLDVCFGAFIFSVENKNFSLLKKPTLSSKLKKTSSFPSISLPKKELVIFVGSFLLSFLFFLFISNMKPKLNLSLPTATPTPTVTPTATATPTPSFKKEELKIKVLNGSGVRGKAGQVKEILKDKGYGEVLTDNADNFDYKVTQINVKKDKTQAASFIQNDLKDYTPAPKIGELSEKEIADVVIIIGADFK